MKDRLIYLHIRYKKPFRLRPELSAFVMGKKSVGQGRTKWLSAGLLFTSESRMGIRELGA